jgi:excisionase family DNA binding protein
VGCRRFFRSKPLRTLFVPLTFGRTVKEYIHLNSSYSVEPLLCSIPHAAAALGVSRSKTYELISEGRLLTVSIGRRRLVRTESIRSIANGEVA